MQYHLSPSDRAKIQHACNEVARLAKIIDPQRRRRGKFTNDPRSLYQIIRGTATETVNSDDSVVNITDVQRFEEEAKQPTEDPVRVATDGAEIEEGDLVWAAYHKDYPVTPIGTEEGTGTEGSGGSGDTVDWVRIPTGGESGPPLKRFELVEDKERQDTTARVRWVDLTNEMYGDELTIYDPSQAFSGRAKEYYDLDGTGAGSQAVESGFQGFALRRSLVNDGTDTGTSAGTGTDEDANSVWTIISMEGFAEIVEVVWTDSYTSERWEMYDFFGDQWEWRRPADYHEDSEEGTNASVGTPEITILDPLDLGFAKQFDDHGLAILHDPDTTPPTYMMLSFKPQDGSGGDAIQILIDEDIEGAEEGEQETLPACEDTEERDLDDNGDLRLWPYHPRVVHVKYFVWEGSGTEGTGTEGTVSDKQILATEEDSEGTGTGTEGATYCYRTKTVYYMDGETFTVGEYDLEDYPDYDENADWPPPGLPENFLKRRWRAQAKRDSSGRYWIDFSTCKPLPAPPLPEE